MEYKKELVMQGVQERIISIRKYLNLNQREFAQRVGCHRNRVSDIERGLREAPKRTIFALHTELNIDLNWLVSESGSMFLTETQPHLNQIPEKPPLELELNKQIALLKELLTEKDRLIAEKDARIGLLEQFLPP
jgi:transcriptional regulator with XRE-family HTH domain